MFCNCRAEYKACHYEKCLKTLGVNNKFKEDEYSKLNVLLTDDCATPGEPDRQYDNNAASSSGYSQQTVIATTCSIYQEQSENQSPQSVSYFQPITTDDEATQNNEFLNSSHEAVFSGIEVYDLPHDVAHNSLSENPVPKTSARAGTNIIASVEKQANASELCYPLTSRFFIIYNYCLYMSYIHSFGISCIIIIYAFAP